MIDHDRLFKELLMTFFVEFLELFFPQMREYLDAESVTFLDKEAFSDITDGKTEADIVARVAFANRPQNSPMSDAFFLIHLENQSHPEPEFNQRLFRYFYRFYEKYQLSIYPIVVFSYDKPRRPEPDTFSVTFPDLEVVTFRYRVVQLNRLSWRDYANQANPVAAALMAKMQMTPTERWRVKWECLRLLVTLRLDRRKMRLISGFVDTYLRLSAEENVLLEQALEQEMPQEEKQMAFELTTSWKEEGIAEGIERGIAQGIERGIAEGLQQGMARTTLRQLTRRLGALPEAILLQIRGLSVEELDSLAEALLDFAELSDLENWLKERQV